MDLFNTQNKDTKKVISLVSDSSTSSPSRIVTSSSPKDFMSQTPRQRKHIVNIVNKIKAINKRLTQTTPHNTQSNIETDYANLITIKKADPQPAQANDSNITQQNTTSLHPQHSSTPTQVDDVQQKNV